MSLSLSLSLFSGCSSSLTIFRGHSRRAVEYFHVRPKSTQYTREKSICHWRIGLDILDNLSNRANWSFDRVTVAFDYRGTISNWLQHPSADRATRWTASDHDKRRGGQSRTDKFDARLVWWYVRDNWWRYGSLLASLLPDADKYWQLPITKRWAVSFVRVPRTSAWCLLGFPIEPLSSWVNQRPRSTCMSTSLN